jgi:hypothetical protein
MTLHIIIRSNLKLEGSNHVDVTYRTFDIDHEAVELFLRGGGMNPDSFLLREVVGVETLTPTNPGAALAEPLTERPDHDGKLDRPNSGLDSRDERT